MIRYTGLASRIPWFSHLGSPDLKGDFDTIPHDQLLKAVRMRITDGSVLRMIEAWLTAPVIEQDESGRQTGHRPDRGSPQGGVFSRRPTRNNTDAVTGEHRPALVRGVVPSRDGTGPLGERSSGAVRG